MCWLVLFVTRVISNKEKTPLQGVGEVWGSREVAVHACHGHVMCRLWCFVTRVVENENLPVHFNSEDGCCRQEFSMLPRAFQPALSTRRGTSRGGVSHHESKTKRSNITKNWGLRPLDCCQSGFVLLRVESSHVSSWESACHCHHER
jgi:hypothetical protein